MRQLSYIVFSLCSTLLLSWCSIIPQEFQEFQDSLSTTVNIIKDQTTEFKENIIIMVWNAEVTALPIINDIKKKVTEQINTINSLKKWKPSTDTTILCLQKQGLTYYTSQTCTFALQQRELMGDDLKSIDTIRCDENKDLITCSQKGVQWTPAFWNSAWKVIHWVQTLDSLAKEFGCN